jgi:hypothetical protein
MDPAFLAATSTLSVNCVPTMVNALIAAKASLSVKIHVKLA